MCYSATAVANFFIQEAIENKFFLTHLHLQKMMFFSHAEYLKKNKKPLFSDAIFAWQHGPVIGSIYNELRTMGANRIDKTIDKIEFNPQKPLEYCTLTPVVRANDEMTIEFLRISWMILSSVEPWKLRNLSHAKGGAWYTTVEGQGLDPSNENDIKNKLPRNLTILDATIEKCGR